MWLPPLSIVALECRVGLAGLAAQGVRGWLRFLPDGSAGDLGVAGRIAPQFFFEEGLLHLDVHPELIELHVRAYQPVFLGVDFLLKVTALE